MNDASQDLVDRTRRLIAACPSIDDFVSVRPMSLGLAVCNAEAVDPTVRAHISRWLDYWGTRLDRAPCVVGNALTHLSYAKWRECGATAGLSVRSITIERRRIGIGAHGDAELTKLRLDVARELDIPPYMLGVA